MELVSKHGSTRFVLLIAAIAALGGFLFGFDSSVIANAKDQVSAQFGLSDFDWAKIVSISLLGSMLGIPVSGFISDHISRKTLLQLLAIGFIAGSVISACATTLSILYVGRLIIGICIGIASYISPLFIAEMAPRNSRGSLILMNGIAITFGQAACFLIGYAVHDYNESSWRLLLMIGTIPAALLLLGMFFVPHSPRWVMIAEGKAKALQILEKIRYKKSEIHEELREIEHIITQTKSANMLHALFKPPFIYVVFFGILLGIGQAFTGINAIMYYGPVIFETAGFHPIKNAILATSWLGFLNFAFTMVTFYLADKIGRRRLMLSGLMLAAISMLSISVYFNYAASKEKWAIVSLLSTFIIGYCISIGSLYWVVIAEIYPLKIRGLAMSIATVVQWAANFVVSISFLTMFNALGGLKMFWVFGGLCTLLTIICYYYLPETALVSLESIEENLINGKSLRELGQPAEGKKRIPDGLVVSMSSKVK